MKVIDVFKCYYEAECVFSGVPRHGAAVTLTATSDEGQISYEAGVSFFPHNAPDDFGISYDAYASRTVYSGKGRRSKKREQQLLAELQKVIDEAAGDLDGKVFWDKALIEPRLG